MERKKKSYITIIVINIIVFIINTCLLMYFALGSFLDDYVQEVSKGQKYFGFIKGVIVAIIICLLLNYISVKLINKNEKKFEYKKVIIIPIVFVIIQSICILILQ